MDAPPSSARRRASSRACAERSIALPGTQATWGHSPPTLCASTRATDLPRVAGCACDPFTGRVRPDHHHIEVFHRPRLPPLIMLSEISRRHFPRPALLVSPSRDRGAHADHFASGHERYPRWVHHPCPPLTGRAGVKLVIAQCVDQLALTHGGPALMPISRARLSRSCLLMSV